MSGQDCSGHTPNRYHISRPAATNLFPRYFPESMPPFQQYPAYPQSWPGTPEPEQNFSDTLTKILQTQTRMQSLMDKMSLRLTELENSLKGTCSTSSSSDEKKRVSPQLSVSACKGCGSFVEPCLHRKWWLRYMRP